MIRMTSTLMTLLVSAVMLLTTAMEAQAADTGFQAKDPRYIYSDDIKRARGNFKLNVPGVGVFLVHAVQAAPSARPTTSNSVSSPWRPESR